MARTISRQDLKAKIDDKAPIVILEALPESSYLKGHLPGALNVPHERVRELVPGLVPDQTTAIVTYCASATCRNSHIAADTLRAMGYTNVEVYAEGKQDWVEAGLPLDLQQTRAA
ncbi:MAG: rhodanese-like domain-containing protein [Hyphomonadaceae bacterium]|jgi:rhodanese-related sulfurtransferase|nr:rhodanese-like domain-containing protein [Hyphomonadaceae bacterium]